MIIYLLVSIAIAVVGFFATDGFIILILPQYTASVFVGFLMRAALNLVSFDRINKYISSIILAAVQFCVFLFVNILISSGLVENYFEYIKNSIELGWPLLLFFYISFLASFFFRKQIP